MNDRDLTVVELKLTCGKATTTFLLAMLAGEITLLGTVFADSEDKTFAMISIICMVVASIRAQSFADDAICEVTDLRVSKALRWAIKMPLFRRRTARP